MRDPLPASTRSRLRLAPALAVLAACAAALLLARPASGGSYVTTLCSALNPSAGEASWEPSSHHYAQRSRCGSGEGVQVFHDAESTDLNRYGAWVWRAPPGTVLTSIQANASLANEAGHHGELWASYAGGGGVQWGSEHADFRTHSIGGELSQFSVMLRCAAPELGGRCGAAGGDAAHAYLKGLFARVEDRAGPTLAIEGGSLLEDAVVRGTRTLALGAADAGSGVRTISILANGAELGRDARNCALAAGYATALSPCPPSTTELAGIDTAGPAFTLGPDNLIGACVEDLALDGIPNRACAERRVWVDNACPGSSAPADALSASFAGEHAQLANGDGSRAAVRSDRTALLAGRLTAAGSPVPGATVCALTRVRLAGEPVTLEAGTRTDAAGNYAIELPAGPSRAIFVHQARGDRVVARHGLELDSEVRPTLEVLPRRTARNRKRLRFTGALPGPACVERVVKVQARVGRRRWQVFRTDRADAECRFRARYRLRATHQRTVYRFRAYVPGQDGYPYVPGYSAVERQKVKPARRP